METSSHEDAAPAADHPHRAALAPVIEQLAGGLAHQYNNLLTIIQGHTRLLEGNVSAEWDRSLAEISRAAGRAARLTEQLVLFSGQHGAELAPVELSHLAHRVIDKLQQSSKLAVTFACSAAYTTILADAGFLEQILRELLVSINAHLPPASRLVVQLDPVEAPAGKTGSFLCLAISDNGPHLTDAQRGHFFEPFFGRKKGAELTGLELAAAKSAIEQHSGTIEIRNNAGPGKSVRIYLPLLRNKGPREARILFIEDEASVRQLLQRALERKGWRVFSAGSAAEARALWQAHSRDIDLLVTDLCLEEDVSGFDLAEEFTHDRSDLQVVYASGYHERIRGKGTSLQPGKNFLRKPFDPDQLTSLIARLLA